MKSACPACPVKPSLQLFHRGFTGVKSAIANNANKESLTPLIEKMRRICDPLIYFRRM